MIPTVTPVSSMVPANVFLDAHLFLQEITKQSDMLSFALVGQVASEDARKYHFQVCREFLFRNSCSHHRSMLILGILTILRLPPIAALHQIVLENLVFDGRISGGSDIAYGSHSRNFPYSLW